MSTIWLRWRRSALTAPTILALFACGGTVQVEDLVPDADGFYTTGSGLRFQILAEGEGPKPKWGDTVRLHYSTARPDGTVIDSSFERGEPDVMALRDVVRGFREALRLMPVGSRYKVIVPGKLAYGREGIPGLVGPNETLTFIIHLHGIERWIPLCIGFDIDVSTRSWQVARPCSTGTSWW